MHYVLSIYRYAGTEDIDGGDAPSQLVSHDPADSDMQLLAMLDALGLISPAAYVAPIHDVIHQVNNVNGGEYFVTTFARSATTMDADDVDEAVEDALDAAGMGYHA